jgi:hypothetical protein
MVVVLGLDRLDGTPIATMPDHLWSQHSAEIKHRFEAQQQHDACMNHEKTASCCALGFTDFCKTFATVGGNMTQAMRDHAAATAPLLLTTVAGPAITMMPDDGSNIVLSPGAPQPTPPHVAGAAGQRRVVGGKGGLGPAWTRGEIEPPTEEKNMGSWTARVYSAEQQQRLGINESGKPVAPVAPVALDTICPNSMNGTHCYKSRANVFKCTQCGAKQ